MEIVSSKNERPKNNSYSNTFFKLREKLQKQMKNSDIKYNDILELVKNRKND